MNTVETGITLEKQIYELFSANIRAGKFLVSPDQCRIFRQKGYYSKDRGSNIIFDVAIELYLPNAREYSLLWLFECKNYSEPVPVSDAEEFFAKIQQVAPANCKGVIVAPRGFQSGTINFAKSKGIGLLRYTKRKAKWELRRTHGILTDGGHSASRAQLEMALNGLDQLEELPFVCMGDNGEYTSSLLQFFIGSIGRTPATADLARLVIAQPPAEPVVPYVRQEDIEKRSEAVLKEIGFTSGAVSLEDICAWQAREAGLHIERESPPPMQSRTILGRIDFDSVRIVLYDRDDIPLAVSRFTLAHELGHLLLGHGQFIETEYNEESDLNESALPTNEDIRRLEWQANQFASSLLLPKMQVVADLRKMAIDLDLKDKGYGLIFLDDQPVNRRTWSRVASALRAAYAVSTSVVYYRLKALGALRDERDGSAIIGSLIDRP